MFSQADCDHYHWYLYWNRVCEDNSTSYVTDPESLYRFTSCITIHFMTEMGANNSCCDDTVKSYINTTVKNTITLLSKDRLFYSFLVDTLNAGNICQAANDTSTVPSSLHNCYEYMSIMRHGGSKCTYDTTRIDRYRQVYSDCLYNCFLKSLMFDYSVCKDWTLICACSLFGFMKELLQEVAFSMDSAIDFDKDTIVQTKNMFSDAECQFYYDMKKIPFYSICENNSMLFVTNPEWFEDFTKCIIYHFMTDGSQQQLF